MHDPNAGHPEPGHPESGHRAGRPSMGRVRGLARWGSSGRAGTPWRLVVPLVFAMAGFMFVTSAAASDGADLRPQRSSGLAEVVQTERQQVSQLQRRAGNLEDQVRRLTDDVGDKTIGRLQARADRLSGPAQMLPVSGPGLQVTLEDAPVDQPIPEGYTANDVVVHQQDLQAVVNALWAGGARGITLQGQRLISTTGIKCVGNTVVLHGVPYSPPYVIRAVGDPVALQNALDASEYIQNYLGFTEPPFNIGWDVELLTDATLPGHRDAVDVEYAEAVGVPAPGAVAASS